MQLVNFLDANLRFTQPVVAYGGPVRDWLRDVYKEQTKEQLPSKSGENPLRVLSLVELQIASGAKTPVLCANHSSMYLYDTYKPVLSKPCSQKPRRVPTHPY